MSELIRNRILALEGKRQASLFEWLEIINNAPDDVPSLIDVFCDGEPLYLGPCRNVLSAIVNADELEVLADRLGEIDDSSARESFYWVVEAGIHRVKSPTASKVFKRVASGLCSDISAHSSGGEVSPLTIVAGVYATVACGLYARGPLEQPENQCPLSDDLKSIVTESIDNREKWVEMGRQDPLQFWGFVGALYANEKLNWLVKAAK